MGKRLVREVGMRARHLDDRQLERKPGVSSLAHVLDRDCEEIDESQHCRLGQLVCLLSQQLLRLFGHRQRLGHVTHVLDEQQMTQVLEEVRDQASEVLSLLGQLLDEDQRPGGVAIDDHVADAQKRLLLDCADELEHGLGVDRTVGRGGELIERRDRVAERATRAAGDQGERGVRSLDLLTLGDATEQCDELG